MKTINIYIVKYEHVFMTFFDGMIYMRHASIVFTVFSYTSVLVFLCPLDGHIDIDQSHVLGLGTYDDHPVWCIFSRQISLTLLFKCFITQCHNFNITTRNKVDDTYSYFTTWNTWSPELSLADWRSSLY